MHIQVNNTRNKALFKCIDLTIAYLQSCCHLNTAVPILHYSDEAADEPLHPSCPSLLLFSMGTSLIQRMRKMMMMMTPEPLNLEARVGEDVRDNLTAAVSAANIHVLSISMTK
ncbi:hypothetical protein DPX16_18840 [Anabarilius grahami]|uniref:Uncharacterized protein n=1 Tax=Anabarilius grahami TaxID=495550 RepID=A0A3N0Y3C4_ANAGA|nr:hypothetical protein DPX16_18840 [Anabarilius grahami]